MATEYQIKILEQKLASMKQDEQGKYDSHYYALFNKIKNLKKEMLRQDTKSWEDYLAK